MFDHDDDDGRDDHYDGRDDDDETGARVDAVKVRGRLGRRYEE